jgi:colanic acid/amylovoran biosynthesis protein
MTIKIALINIHSFHNAGDAALSLVAIQQIREHFPNCEITLIMNDPQSYDGGEKKVLSLLTWINQSRTKPLLRFAWLVLISLLPALTQRILHYPVYLPTSKDIKPTIQSIVEANIVIGTPGGYLYSYGKGRALLYLTYTMVLAIISGKPLYLLPQSYGPFKYQYEKKMLRWVLSRSHSNMVREPVSMDYLISIGVPKSKCLLLPDMAFAYNPQTKINIEQWFRSKGVDLNNTYPLMGMTIINWGAQYKGFDTQLHYEKVIAETIKYFIEKYKGKVILYPQSCGPTKAEDDRIPSYRVADLLPDTKQNLIVIKDPLPPSALKSAFGKMDIFIGTRMHSNIFALTEFVPVIAIGYLHKTLGIAHSVGIDRWVIDIKQIDKTQLIEKLDDLWFEKEKIRSQLNKTIPKLAKQVNQTASFIYNDYTKYMKGNLNE